MRRWLDDFFSPAERQAIGRLAIIRKIAKASSVAEREKTPTLRHTALDYN